MPGKIEGFLSDSSSPEKELTRKLYWSVTSTIPLNREQKKTTFGWACRLAGQLLERAAANPSPRLPSPNGKGGKLEETVAPATKKRYHGQAGGGVAGSSIKRRTVSPSSLPQERHPSSSPSQDFLDTQARLKAAAIRYMKDGTTKVSIN